MERQKRTNESDKLIINNLFWAFWPALFSFRYLHKMISRTMKMKPKLPTIAANIGMSYSLVDCLNSGWIVSQFGCIVICEATTKELIFCWRRMPSHGFMKIGLKGSSGWILIVLRWRRDSAWWVSDYTAAADKKLKLMPPDMKARARGTTRRKERKQKVGHLLFVMLNVIQAKFDEDWWRSDLPLVHSRYKRCTLLDSE